MTGPTTAETKTQTHRERYTHRETGREKERAVQYLGTGRVNADSVVKVGLGGVKLQSHGPALSHLTGVRSNHVQTHHTLLSDHTHSHARHTHGSLYIQEMCHYLHARLRLLKVSLSLLFS